MSGETLKSSFSKLHRVPKSLQKSVSLCYLCGPCMKWNCKAFIVFALCFSKFKVGQARLAPEELKGHPMDMYGVHVCASLLYNNVCCFLCLCVLRKNPNKPTQIECDLLSLSSQDQSQILVVLPFFSQRPFSQDS